MLNMTYYYYHPEPYWRSELAEESFCLNRLSTSTVIPNACEESPCLTCRFERVKGSHWVDALFVKILRLRIRSAQNDSACHSEHE